MSLRPAPALLLATALAMPIHCGISTPRSPYSFDEIEQKVGGKPAREVEALLGRPDARQRLSINDEKWIWWNYTVLDGDRYAPEVHRWIVHLEILFQCREGEDGMAPTRGCRAAGAPTVVSYSHPAAVD